jgi:transketolase
MSDLFDCRDAFVAALLDLAQADGRIVALTNDSVSSSKLGAFAAAYPHRFFNVGIAEQDMVGIAAGLANGGKMPFVCGAACFLTGRALEQIKVDLAYTNANVKLCGMSSGLAYGALGATHHSIEDIAWTRSIANMTVIAPADPVETEGAMRAAARHQGPVYLRFNRMPVPMIHPRDYVFAIGKAAWLRRGDDLTVIANGTMVCRALEAADLLARQGVSAGVLDMASVSPLDRAAVIEAAQRGPIVAVEEHSVHGGLGGAVAEVVVASHPTPMRLLGVPGVFAPTGPAEWLFEYFGLTPAGIRDAALDLLRGR